jgi:hypothetical protein
MNDAQCKGDPKRWRQCATMQEKDDTRKRSRNEEKEEKEENRRFSPKISNNSKLRVLCPTPVRIFSFLT